jgi:acyl carrier protein
MTAAEILARTSRYVRDNFLYMRKDTELGEHDSLLGSGVIDSMGVLELVEFVQGEFDVAVDDEDITQENFGSLAAITRYILSKRAQVAA